MGLLIFFSFRTVNAGLNKFTNLIYVGDWIIERKVDLENNKIKCRASLPNNATWFGSRVRIGSDNKLIKPIDIAVKNDQLLNSKLIKVKKILDDCRSGLLFLP